MATIRLPPDFKEFLRLLNSHGVEYLLVDAYAVGYYGYPRPTGDMDVWVAMHQRNAERLVEAIAGFGFRVSELSPGLFLKKDQHVRMGIPPLRIDVLTRISGIRFEECYPQRTRAAIEDVTVDVISLEHLKKNKKASGRHKDLDDLEHLP